MATDSLIKLHATQFIAQIKTTKLSSQTQLLNVNKSKTCRTVVK